MKKIYSLILFTTLFISVEAQTFNWAKDEGKFAYDYGYGITTDNTGNVYVAGKYEEYANFSGTILPCEGNHDIWVAQYSAGGTLNWIRTAGGTSGDYAWGIACDNSFLYVAGEIEGTNETILFPGSAITLTCISSNDIFLAKYDLTGNLIWARSAGGFDYDKALGVTYDQSGNVYICGIFEGAATFGGTTTINSNGDKDIFVAKYDKDGTFQWVQNAGGAGRDEAKSIKCDASGNIYICGMYKDGCVFGTQTLSTYNNTAFYDIFLAKYSSAGVLQWVKTAGSDYDDLAWSLTMDNAGKIFVTGEFVGYVLFDAIPLTTVGSSDLFVACYDATTGNVQWAKSAGGTLVDRARGIGYDGNNFYITGQFGNTADFGSYTINAADSSDIFIASLNNNGTFLWAKAVGGVADSVEELGYESGNAVCAFNSENVYATGSLLDGGVFGSTSLNEYGRTDVFIAKISQVDVTAPALTSLSPVDNTVNAAKNSNLIIVFDESVKKGSGNIIIKEGGILTQTIAVSGTNVTVSGNTVTVDPADFGNDVSVNVEMGAGVFKDMSDNNYAGITGPAAWNFTIGNGPTIVIYNPADNASGIDKNFNLILSFDKNIQKGSGDIIIKEGGIIKQTIAVSETNVTISASTVTINAADFSNGAFVNIEMPAGIFKDMSNNDCAGITNASTWNFTIKNNTSVAGLNTKEKIKIYPNPSDGKFRIQNSEFRIDALAIYNLLGKKIYSSLVSHSLSFEIDLSAEEKGIYFIEIKSEDQSISRGKIILQ